VSFPAARITDMTAHGGAITIGGPTTLIGSMPAARVADMHACPMVTVAVPHATGAIVLGAFNVLVGGMPQARVLDMCICVGPPSLVMLGSFTTLVGMAGAFDGAIGGVLGSMLGSALAGAQSAAGGFPKSVSCPKDAENPGGYKTQFSKAVTVEGPPDFQAKTCADLGKISSTEAGGKNLAAIDQSGHSVTIRPSSGEQA
jgi:uncharacterized Zn-binding protein involved in type VI secretion